MHSRIPSILVLSFRPKTAKHDGVERLRKLLAPYAKLFVASVKDELEVMPPPSESLRYIDGLFILGSSDLFFDGQKDALDPVKEHTQAVVRTLKPLVDYIMERDFPTFAFCFGHQLIAHCMGSPIIASSYTGKVGTYEVELTHKGMRDPLFESFPHSFYAHYGHRDVVAVRPHESELLAHGRLCHNAMLRYRSRIYSSQFHPELDGELVQKYLSSHEAYSEKEVSHGAIGETPDAETLPIRFIQLITRNAQN
ncbi:MAG: hypothetical protein RIQ56_86 [Candidatus Parcubacteria bacterium]|jgi:GMP synthase (glutamine-hydrolysing)